MYGVQDKTVATDITSTNWRSSKEITEMKLGQPKNNDNLPSIAHAVHGTSFRLTLYLIASLLYSAGEKRTTKGIIYAGHVQNESSYETNSPRDNLFLQ